MLVKVRAYAMLRRYVPGVALGQSAVVELPPEATVGDALDRLGIPRAETKVCFVGGVRRELDHQLRDADELAVFPPVAGGSGRIGARYADPLPLHPGEGHTLDEVALPNGEGDQHRHDHYQRGGH